MNSLKEKKILVRMKQRLGEEVPQELLDEIAEEEAKIAAQQEKQVALQEERKNAFKGMFSDLSSQLGQLMAEEKKKTAEEQAILDRFSGVLSRVDEIKAQIAARSEQTTEEFIEEIIPQTVEMIPEEIVETTSIILAPEEPPAPPPIKDPIKDVANKIKVTKPPSAFVQPDPPPVSRDIKDIQGKLKMLEGWVSKISMSGPGGGAVWLRDLDDVARSSVLGATEGQVLTYNEDIKRWEARDPTGGDGGGIPQVQSDWAQTNTASKSYIKNKPVVLNGVDGANGANGISISTAAVNGNGSLIITYSNTFVANAGHVVGPTGTSGANGANGTNGSNGVSISSAIVNSNGSLIITYSNTATANAGYVIGAAGANGIDGTNGANGIDGANGTNGSDGISITDAVVDSSGSLIITYSNTFTANVGIVVGANGIDGANGTNGVDGANGTNGVDGVDGVGITSAIIDSNGSLIISYSNTFTANAGLVVGSSSNLSVFSVGTEPSSQETLWYNTDDRRTYLFDGTAWVDANPQVVVDTFSGDYNDLDNRPDLFSGDYADLTNKPTIVFESNSAPSNTEVLWYNTDDFRTYIHNTDAGWIDASPQIPSDSFSGDYNDLDNKPTLFSGSYNDLTDQPTLFSGDYNDLINTPSIGSAANLQYYEDNIIIEGEGKGLVVDAGGDKRFGFMKYFGIEGTLVHTVGPDKQVPLRFGRVNTNDVTTANQSSLTTEVYIGTNGNVGIGNNVTSPSERLEVAGNVKISDGSGLIFDQNDIGAPVSGSSTDRINLYPIAGNWGYGIGIESGYTWFNTGQGSNGYKFYNQGNLNYRFNPNELTQIISGEGVIKFTDGTINNFIVNEGAGSSAWGGPGSLSLLTYEDHDIVFFQNQGEAGRISTGQAWTIKNLTATNPIVGSVTGSANNSSYLGGVAANQYAYANSLSVYQTTAGLSANVATLTSNNSLYLGGVAANQYAYANGSNFSINNPLTVTYTPATTTGAAFTATGKDTQGGTGYFDFFKATNTTAGVTNGTKTFRLGSTGTIEILNSAYSAAITTIDNSGNIITTGSVRPLKWEAGQIIKDTMLDNTQFTVSATTVATTTTDTDFITYSYTPVSNSSYLVIHMHVGNYDAATGTGGGSDSYIARIKVGGSEITYGRQHTVTSSSFRTGTLFPLIGRYTNSDTGAKTITVGVRRDSADDSITIVNSSTSLWMRITEIAR